MKQFKYEVHYKGANVWKDNRNYSSKVYAERVQSNLRHAYDMEWEEVTIVKIDNPEYVKIRDMKRLLKECHTVILRMDNKYFEDNLELLERIDPFIADIK